MVRQVLYKVAKGKRFQTAVLPIFLLRANGKPVHQTCFSQQIPARLGNRLQQRFHEKIEQRPVGFSTFSKRAVFKNQLHNNQ